MEFRHQHGCMTRPWQPGDCHEFAAQRASAQRLHLLQRFVSLILSKLPEKQQRDVQILRNHRRKPFDLRRQPTQPNGTIRLQKGPDKTAQTALLNGAVKRHF